MRMTSSNYDRLAAIIPKPSLTGRDRLIIARRLARHHSADYSYHYAQMKKLAATASSAYKTAYEALMRQWHDTFEKMMCDIGEFLMDSGHALEQEIGREGLLDLLNVNPVHRPQAFEQHRNGRDFLNTIAGWCALEDSAQQLSGRRQPDFKDGPLFTCYLEIGCRWVEENPGALTNALSAPGGLLHGVPVYHMQQDGSVTRKGPALTLHRPDGSTKVVERKPQVIGQVAGNGQTKHCKPHLDELTHVQLLALLSDLVEIREAEVDPCRHSALTTVTTTLCGIIARHEPKEGV